MSFIENIRLALSGIRASKMRSLLTMLGIIIGIGSVIAIVTVGNSLTYSINDAMEDLGVNQIQIFVTNKEPNTNPTYTSSDLITENMIEAFQKKFDHKLLSVNLSEGGVGGQARDGRRYANVTIGGGNENYISDNNIELIAGSDIRERDVERASRVAIVSSNFVEKMFPPNVDPLGQEIKIHTKTKGVLTFTILGVYKFKLPAIASAFVSEDDIETQIVVPVSTVKRLLDLDEGYYNFGVHFPPGADSKELATEIEDFFAQYYKNNVYFTVKTQNMETMMETFTTMMGTISVAISIIAGISLLVGGIGVMNIMLVSVTERTREIGTRKALGAKSSAIRIQFIIESMILCLIGGIIGVALGLLLGMGGSAILGFPAAPDITIILIAVGFSMAIGVFFGYYPANKAAKLDPIEALRYE